MSKKEFVAVIDTETMGTFSAPIVYDFGVAIMDRDGVIVDKLSVLFSDIYFIKETLSVSYDVLKSDFASKKVPEYLTGVFHGDFEPMPYKKGCKKIKAFLKKYNVNKE